jgi:mono/diheme cytochrome c family protein
MSVALVSGQSGQTAQPPKPASTPVARAQALPQAPAGPQSPAVKDPTVAGPDAATQRALVDQYCVKCHNARLKTANLLLDQLDLAHLGDHAEIGEKVVRKLRAGRMPPTGLRRPDAATLESLIRGMEAELDRSAAVHLPAPGLHRLNRTEYSNAIRDLLALEVDATKFLPADDSTRGFDNIAGALTMSPALMEAYLSAPARSAGSRLAMSAPRREVFDARGHRAELPRRAAVRRAAAC